MDHNGPKKCLFHRDLGHNVFYQLVSGSFARILLSKNTPNFHLFMRASKMLDFVKEKAPFLLTTDRIVTS